jgi:hypothetical protein
LEREHVWNIGEDNTSEDTVEYTGILEEFRDVFAWNMAKMTTIKDEQFRIPVTDPSPVLRQQYKLLYAEKEILAEQMEACKAAGFIRPSISKYGAPVTMPPKKDEFGNWTLKRPCCDYRMLNKIPVTDRYVLPTSEDILNNIKDAGVYTTLDLRWGFHQVRVAEEDVSKTAFWGPDGLYEWVVMPFGLKNAPVFFQRIMDKTLRDVRAFARFCIDDNIIFSRSHAEHKVHLQEVFWRPREKGIECHPKKLRCAVKDVSYLGHLVVPNGTAPQDVKVEAITKMVAPTDVSELRVLLSTYNYFRKFIKNLARKAAPLNRLLQNDVPWEWSEPCQKALELLKVSMTEAPILRRPNINLPFELHTDWSAVRLGAILVQIDSNGKEFVIAYALQSNNRTERNYLSYYGECLAAVWAVSYFRIYLYGCPFVLKTDHKPLKWLMTSKKLTGMHARWASILQEYDMDIQRKAGVTHGDVDGLWRNPLPSEEDRTDARMHHDSPVTSVTAGLVLLACLGAEAIKAAASQPEFGGTEKDGDPQATESSAANSASCDVWQDSATIAYLRTSSHALEQIAPAKDRI